MMDHVYMVEWRSSRYFFDTLDKALNQALLMVKNANLGCDRTIEFNYFWDGNFTVVGHYLCETPQGDMRIAITRCQVK